MSKKLFAGAIAASAVVAAVARMKKKGAEENKSKRPDPVDARPSA